MMLLTPRAQGFHLSGGGRGGLTLREMANPFTNAIKQLTGVESIVFDVSLPAYLITAAYNSLLVRELRRL